MLVHTGQNWDHRLNGVFFDEMGLRPPDHVLDVDTSSLGATLGDILRKTEAVLDRAPGRVPCARGHERCTVADHAINVSASRPITHGGW